MNNQNKNYISKKEVARICETSESSIVRWVHSTDFPKPFQLGGRTVFIRKEVLLTRIQNVHKTIKISRRPRATL